MKDWELSYRNNGRYLKSDQKKKKKEKNQSDAAALSFEEWSQKKKETAAAKPSFEEWSNTKKKFAEAFAPIAVKGAYMKNEADDVNVGMADGDYSESKETGGKSKTTVTRTGKKKTTTTENKVTHRDANLMDITLRSLKRGYYNARYGEESYAAMFGQDNKKAAYEEILNGDEYKFVPSNKLEEGVAGAFELLGQQARQFTNPTSVTAGTAAAGGAFVAGQLGPQIGTPEEVITVPGAFVMGLSAGSAASNLEIEAGLAYNEMIEAGITEDTARKVALGVGSVNAGLELLQIDELLDAYKVVSKGATKGVGKKIAKELADRGVSVVTETAQEVAQEGVTIAGTQVASKIETGDWAYSADDVKDRLVDTAKSSALSFGIMNVPAAVRNSASYATEQKNAKKLTSNEEKVVEKEVENRVAEEETNGKKLSNKVKNKIYDAVIKDLEKGNISTDTIEEVLGGETYTSYREAVDREDALQKEFDTLNKMKQGDMTGEQVDRREELRQQLKDIQENAQRDQLKTRLGEEVSEMVRGERLSESYNEKARRSQAFDVDVTQYDAKQQETVQKAIDSGVLNNTNRTHEFVDMIAKISAEKGVSFDFTDNAKLKETGFALEGKTVNGYVTDSGITINVNSAKAFNSVVGHEVTHVLEGTELYDTLQQTLFEYAKSKGDYQSRLDALTALYKDVEGTDINAELTADLVGDYLFTDTDFVMKLSTEHRNIFQKIFDEIKYLCKAATAGSKEARQLEEVRKVFEEAYRESGKVQKNTATEGGVRYALSNQNGYDYSQSFEQQIDDYKAGKIPSRDTLLVGATPEVYQSIGLNALPMTINTTHVDYALNGTKDADHYLGEAVLKQLPESIKDPVAVFVSRTKSGSSVVALLNFNVNGKRVVAPVEIDGFGFQNGIRIDSNAVTSIYGKNSALKQLYQAAQNESNGIFSLLYANKKEAYSLLQSAGYQLSGGLIPHDGFYHSIRENNSPVKPKFNNVAESQQFKRWFGDWQKHPKNASKVVDSDGNPLVVYHGTDAEFTEFNTDNQRTNSKLNFGKGIYLNPNKNLAEMYTTTGNVMELYASVKNPYEIFSTRLDESDLQKLSAEFGENVTLENIDAVLQKNKFDGIIARNYNGTTNPINQIVVFNSNQVKSATDNIGTFDGNNPDIRYSLSSGNENTAPVKGGIYGKDILLAPVGENVVRTQTASPDNLVPIGENVERTGVAKDVAPATKKKETDKRAEQEKIAEILTEEPTPANRKSRIWAKFMANFVDKGAAFEDLSLKTKNRELMGKWNYMLHSEARAQQFIGNGTDNVKSLNAIREEVDGTGLTNQFYDYLYHKHNVDRMQLSERYEDMPNKPVFGDSVTADVSKEVAEQYESEHPEFQQYAQDVYDYMNHLRQLMVDSGVISQETADLWSEMYPHYVPIRRTGDTGLNINVPLDTGRTGVNAPVKGATGGNSDILPLFDTMGQRTIQTFKAIDKNSFGLELKNTLGTAIASETASVDDAIDSIDMQEGLLQEGKNGGNPTFTVFENGERVTFEISEDMYDALKPVSEGLAYTNKALNTINNIRRGLLTEYNPTFMLTNAIKDAQDVLLNSQHPMKTYAKLPEAYAQLFRKGYWYKEYVENGGEQNTYFDNKTYTFTTENKGLAKLLNMPPLSTISKVNSFIEMAPRLAEYIASREAGRSVEVSMLDAARVTTNFAAGGDVTKFLNRNGATFLNASVQGAMQQVRNVREAKANGLKGWVNLAAKFIAAGLPALLLNGLIWDDDEEYQELSDYVKQSYYIIGKYDDGKFVRIPKGRTVAVIQNAFELVSDSLTGDDEVDLSRFLELGALAVSNIAPNNPIDNNILAPIFQAVGNETWYGEDLVPSRLQDLPAAEQFDESTDAISKWLGEKLNISPVKINYLLDQYSGGLGDVFLPMMTPQAESGDNSFIGNMLAPLKDKFTADSVMNNQNVSDFYDTVDMLATGAKKSNATDEDVLKYKYINSINADLSDLYKKKREIQNSDLANDEKYEQIRELQQQIDDVAKEGLSTYGDVTISGSYAAVGDRHYKLNDDGEWQKLNDKQVEKMEIFSKVVGGNAAYISRFGDLSAIKSDKDENGETISGSRKDKVIEYINNLDADYGEKIILFRSQYTGDDTYNYEIIDYLNSRDDISYEEMETILKELGFEVLSDGTVKW